MAHTRNAHLESLANGLDLVSMVVVDCFVYLYAPIGHKHRPPSEDEELNSCSRITRIKNDTGLKTLYIINHGVHTGIHRIPRTTVLYPVLRTVLYLPLLAYSSIPVNGTHTVENKVPNSVPGTEFSPSNFGTAVPRTVLYSTSFNIINEVGDRGSWI